MIQVPKDKMLDFVHDSIVESNSNQVIEEDNLALRAFFADSIQKNFLNSSMIINPDTVDAGVKAQLETAAFKIVRNQIAYNNPEMFETDKRVTISVPQVWIDATVVVIKFVLKKVLQYREDLANMEKSLIDYDSDKFDEELTLFINELI